MTPNVRDKKTRCLQKRNFLSNSFEGKEEEIIRLPWRGQCGRAAAGSAALSLRCAASTSANVYTGYA
jgi:hypothetical protein